MVVAVLCVGLSDLALEFPGGPIEDGPGTSHQATGFKVGEVTDHSAIVWMRLTENPTRNEEGILRKGHIDKSHPASPLPDDVRVEELEGDCPGAPGRSGSATARRKTFRTPSRPSGSRSAPTPTSPTSSGSTALSPPPCTTIAAETAGPGGHARSRSAARPVRNRSPSPRRRPT